MLTRFFERHAPDFLMEVDARVQAQLNFLGSTAYHGDNLIDHIFSRLVLDKFTSAGNPAAMALEEQLHKIFEMYDEDEIRQIPNMVRLFVGREDKLIEEIARRYHIDDPNLIRMPESVIHTPESDKNFEARLKKECEGNPEVERRFRHYLIDVEQSNTRNASNTGSRSSEDKTKVCCVVS